MVEYNLENEERMSKALTEIDNNLEEVFTSKFDIDFWVAFCQIQDERRQGLRERLFQKLHTHLLERAFTV